MPCLDRIEKERVASMHACAARLSDSPCIRDEAQRRKHRYREDDVDDDLHEIEHDLDHHTPCQIWESPMTNARSYFEHSTLVERLVPLVRFSPEHNELVCSERQDEEKKNEERAVRREEEAPAVLWHVVLPCEKGGRVKITETKRASLNSTQCVRPASRQHGMQATCVTWIKRSRMLSVAK